jgi:hypothetical protein
MQELQSISADFPLGQGKREQARAIKLRKTPKLARRVAVIGQPRADFEVWNPRVEKS